MHLQLGPSGGTLIDGAEDWGQSVESALAIWNSVIRSSTFSVIRDSNVAISSGNRVNNVYFDDNVDGGGFGGAVAITLYLTSGSSITEADVIFNEDLSFNAYRGPLRQASGGETLYDIRRVALHEFGHVLGLDHPDVFGQNVKAIMNSRVSDIDNLLADDIAGGQAIYGGTTVAEFGQIFRPGNRRVTTNNRRFVLRGTATRAAGVSRVFLENNRFRRLEFEASGVARWRARVDLRRGRNRVKVFAEKRNGRTERIGTVIIRSRRR
ncbi:MAG: matrixin family metalloprotease [Chthoniobacterales bacterium]